MHALVGVGLVQQSLEVGEGNLLDSDELCMEQAVSLCTYERCTPVSHSGLVGVTFVITRRWHVRYCAVENEVRCKAVLCPLDLNRYGHRNRTHAAERGGTSRQYASVGSFSTVTNFTKTDVYAI